MKPTLRTHGSNIYSQWGEDGIIAKIFEIIGDGSRTSIEFGAWDGFHLSNTANLWANKGWRGILIEGDASKHVSLVEKVKAYNCIPLLGFVEPEGDNSLESILNRSGIPLKADLLSIDIDSKRLRRICDFRLIKTSRCYLRIQSHNSLFFGYSGKSKLGQLFWVLCKKPESTCGI